MKYHFLLNGEWNRVLRGVALLSDSTRLCEMAGRIGFDTVWLDLEHGSVPDYDRIEKLCVAAEAGGAVPTVRVSDGQRCHILRALELGASVVVVPMIDTAEAARQVVEYGKFPPLGLRGYNTRSRGVNYGLNLAETGDGHPNIFARSNAQTHLFVQIETTDAVGNVTEICAVDGLSGIFIGPGDLSSSLGRPSEINHPEVIKAATECIRIARAAGKHAGILAFPGPLLSAALEAGADFVICGGDINEICSAWTNLLGTIPEIPQHSQAVS